MEAAGKIKLNDGLYNTYIKRTINVVRSFGDLVVLPPIFRGVSLAIIIDESDPVLSTQKRIGKNKEFFQIHKFCSTKMSMPHDVPTHRLSNSEQYITRVGKFLYAHSLDELPQIWDIFVGDGGILGTTKKNLDLTSVLLA